NRDRLRDELRGGNDRRPNVDPGPGDARPGPDRRPGEDVGPGRDGRWSGEDLRNEDIGRIREERRTRRVDGLDVITEPGGRTILRDDRRVIIRNDELDRLEDFGQVRRERRGDDYVTIVERPGGVRIVTITDIDGHVIRRVRRMPDGREYVLFVNRPDLRDRYDVDVIVNLPPPPIDIPRDEYVVEADRVPPQVIYDTFAAPPVVQVDRRYSLEQVVNSPSVLERVRRVDLDTITFDTGSWKVAESEIGALDAVAKAINDLLAKNPNEVFLIEGHTDAVGSDIDNLSLSDRRAEEVAYLLTEYYKVPPENLTTKGYGESQLKVATDGPARENRRVTMRRITPLLETSEAN
ncbi:OmpA family protein, partial [Oharaeibacter diazotrophicus]